MEYRQLGRSGLMVSLYGFGTMTFGGKGRFASVGKSDSDACQRQIAICLDAGVNLFDTADVYSEGLSEELLGEALGKRRQDVVIASKFFGRTGPGVNQLGASRHHIINACEASLRRLKTDYIDLYQIHNQDLLTPPEETLRALDDLVRAGKVRYVGASNHAGWTLMRALATSDRLGITRYVSHQFQYSLLCRDCEDELQPLSVAEDVGAIIWGPLASGYLTGKFQVEGDTGETRVPQRRLLDDLTSDRSVALIDLLRRFADARSGATPAQIALHWIASKAGVSSILIGSRSEQQLTENLRLLDSELSAEEIASLDQASATALRYPYALHAKYHTERNVLPAGQRMARLVR